MTVGVAAACVCVLHACGAATVRTAVHAFYLMHLQRLRAAL